MPAVGDLTYTGRKVAIVVTVVLVLVVAIGALIASTTANTKTIIRSGIAVVEPDLTSQGLYADVFLAQGVAEPVSYFMNCEQFLASVTTRLAAGYAYRVGVINTGLPQVVNGQDLSGGLNIYSEGPLCFDRAKAIDPGLIVVAVMDNDMQYAYWVGRQVSGQVVRHDLFDVVNVVINLIKSS